MAFQLLRNQHLLELLQRVPLAHDAVWGTIACLAVFSLTLTLWALARISLSVTKGSNSAQNLMRLAPFVSFWLTVNGWLTFSKSRGDGHPGNGDGEPDKAPANRKKENSNCSEVLCNSEM